MDMTATLYSRKPSAKEPIPEPEVFWFKPVP